MADCRQFYRKTALTGCQIFGLFGFLKTESEQNFGFPHIPTEHDICQGLFLYGAGNGRGALGDAQPRSEILRLDFTLTNRKEGGQPNPTNRTASALSLRKIANLKSTKTTTIHKIGNCSSVHSLLHCVQKTPTFVFMHNS